MKLRMILISLSVWATGASAQATIDGSEMGLDPETIKNLISVVTKDLLDPTAAQFRGLQHPSGQYTLHPERTICGFVNGKNAFGGYVGFRPFTYDKIRKEATVYEKKDDPSFDKLAFMPIKRTGCAAALSVDGAH